MRSQVAGTCKPNTDRTIFKITRVNPASTEQRFGFVHSQHSFPGRHGGRMASTTYSLMVGNQAETNTSPPSFAITGLGVKGKDTRKRALCSPEEWLRPQFGLFKTIHGQHHTQSCHQLPALLPFPLRAATFLRQGPNARAAWRGREHSAVMAAHGRRELGEKSGLLPSSPHLSYGEGQVNPGAGNKCADSPPRIAKDGMPSFSLLEKNS